MKVGNLIEVSGHGTGIIASIDWCDVDKEWQATIFSLKDRRFIFISDDSLSWIEG
tara:strand:- start:1716 stop:1880 length:165 start_codon:yes stop_codon:yes gene_type:complete